MKHENKPYMVSFDQDYHEHRIASSRYFGTFHQASENAKNVSELIKYLSVTVHRVNDDGEPVEFMARWYNGVMNTK